MRISLARYRVPPPVSDWVPVSTSISGGGHPDVVTQWAAVSTHDRLMTVPPQNWAWKVSGSPLNRMPTCDGHAPGGAWVPHRRSGSRARACGSGPGPGPRPPAPARPARGPPGPPPPGPSAGWRGWMSVDQPCPSSCATATRTSDPRLARAVTGKPGKSTTLRADTGHRAAGGRPPAGPATSQGPVASKIEDYALLSDTESAALVGPGRLDRLADLPPLRLPRPASAALLGGPRARPVDDRPGPPRRPGRAGLPARDPRAGDHLPHPDRHGAGRRLHAGPRPDPPGGAPGRGRRRGGRRPHRAHRAARLRLDRPLGPPRRRPAALRRRPRRPGADLAGAPAAPTGGATWPRSPWPPATRRTSSWPGTRPTSPRPPRRTWAPASSAPPPGGRTWSARCATAGPVGRGGPLLPHRAEGAHLRPHRRHRRRRHHLAPRAAGRRAQLGLPLLLAARRHLHPPGADRGRLHRGGRGLAALAAAGHRRAARPGADHVRTGGRATAAGDGAPLAAGLRGLEPRSASATPPTASSRSTCSARCSTPSTRPPWRGWARPTATPGPSWWPSWTGCARCGASPTTGSGRSGATAATSPTPR